MKRLQVIDFFCGAGGFSEGFRQQAFDIVMGIDSWKLAIESHNLNHGLQDKPIDVLTFESSVAPIEELPDTEVIVGSPPCVSFSLSNKGGKACKKLGVRLIESFLRVVAVKKHQQDSKLVAWFMENVPNSQHHIKPTYSFRDLNLAEWATTHDFNPDKIALNAANTGKMVDTVEYGTAQKRKRFLCGEIIKTGKFPDLSRFMADGRIGRGGRRRGLDLVRSREFVGAGRLRRVPLVFKGTRQGNAVFGLETYYYYLIFNDLRKSK